MKWIVFFGIVAAVHSAAVYQRSDIPVKVVYEKPSYLRNLQARDQLSPQQREYVQRKSAAGIRNLEARSQIPPESVKENAAVNGKIVTPDQPEVEVFNKSPENWQSPDQNIDDIYEKIQEIIMNGANNIKSAADAGHFGEKKTEILKSVNVTFEKVLESTKGLVDLKATDEVKQEQSNNIVQQIFSTIQNFTSSVTSTFTNPQSGAQSDEQPQNPLQSIIGQVQNGIQQVLTTFTGGNPSTQATVLGDNPSSTTPGGPIQFAQNAFQQLTQNFNNLLQPSTQAPNAQGDDATTPGGPFQVIQNVINQFSQAIPNPFAQATTKAPAQNDGASTTQAPNNPLAGITGAIQGFNPLGNSSNPLQGVLGGISGGGNPAQGFIDQANQLVTGNPLEAGQNIANQIGEAVQNANPGQLVGNALSGSKTGLEDEITVEKVTAEETKPIEAERVASNDVIEVVKVEAPVKAEESPEENKVEEKKEEEAKA